MADLVYPDVQVNVQFIELQNMVRPSLAYCKHKLLVTEHKAHTVKRKLIMHLYSAKIICKNWSSREHPVEPKMSSFLVKCSDIYPFWVENHYSLLFLFSPRDVLFPDLLSNNGREFTTRTYFSPNIFYNCNANKMPRFVTVGSLLSFNVWLLIRWSRYEILNCRHTLIPTCTSWLY